MSAFRSTGLHPRLSIVLAMHIIHKALIFASLAAMSFPSLAAAQSAAYQPIYSEASERSYSDANLVIAKVAAAHMNARQYESAIEVVDRLLDRPDLNPFEISNTHYFKGAALEGLAGRERDTDKKRSYQAEALKSYAKAIKARGLLSSEYDSRKMEVASLLRTLGDEEYYGLFDFTHKAISAPRPAVPEAFLTSPTSGYCGVQFDLTDAGGTEDVKAVCTDDILYDVSVRAVSKWRFQSAAQDPYGLSRQNVTRRIYFELTGPGGEILPMKRGELFAKYR